MTRYNNHSGSGTSTGNNGDYDDITVKLQKYAALRLTPTRVNTADTDWGDRFIIGFDDTTVLDGIVFQRDDRPDTWKVFSPKKFFNVGDDGRVYESYDAEADEYTDEMSAQDVLDHARVQGFSETFGGDSYWYTPVGVVIEEADDIALNDDLDTETSDDGIVVGDASMLVGNKSWVRTAAKLLTEEGDGIVATETNDAGNEVPVSDGYGWLTTEEPTLREDLEGRALELFIIEETANFGDGDVTYTTPILLDSKTGERVTIDNAVQEDADDDAEAEPEMAKATDGGTKAESAAETDTETTESPDEPEVESAEPEVGTGDEADTDDETAASEDGSAKSEGEMPNDVPEALDDLIDYFARTQGEVEPEELREFAEDEVDDAGAVDWDAAAAEVENRA